MVQKQKRRENSLTNEPICQELIEYRDKVLGAYNRKERLSPLSNGSTPLVTERIKQEAVQPKSKITVNVMGMIQSSLGKKGLPPKLLINKKSANNVSRAKLPTMKELLLMENRCNTVQSSNEN